MQIWRNFAFFRVASSENCAPIKLHSTRPALLSRDTLEAEMPTRHFRAHQRFSVHLPVSVSAATRPVSARGRSIDLGIGGAAFELDTPLRLGETVHVNLESAQPITLPAEVAWVGWAESSAVRLGVRFRLEDAYPLAVLLDALGVSAEVGT